MANPRKYAESAVTGQILGKDVEPLHAFHSEVLQHHQALYDRLGFPIEKIPERYVGQHLCVALKLLFQCGVISRRVIAHVRYVSPHDFDGHLESGHMGYDDKLFVFVHYVELMDDMKKRIDRVRSVVGLELFDQVPNANVSDSLYLSFVTGKQVVLRRSFFEDREFDKPRFFTRPMTDAREQPRNVVEARSVMVNSLASQNSEAQRDREISVILNLLQEKLIVILAENWVFAFLKESLNLGLQIEDVLLGPLDLF